MIVEVHVIITPKPVVNDPEGLTIRQALRTQGFAEIQEVRSGKYLQIRLEADGEGAAAARVEEMARRLLANHVIEDYRIEVAGSEP